jgi:hypothetical protein
MRFLKFAFAGVASLFIANSAQAGLLLEPYLGYTYGQYDAGGGAKWDTNNPVLGARVGYQAVVFMAGVDYSMVMSGKAKGKDGQSDFDFDASQLFAFAGADLPLIRAWAGYGVQNELKSKGAGAAKLTGSALKVGLGFEPLPIISVNAEYIMSKFDKADGTSFSPEGKNDVFLLSVSAPFDL